MDQAADDDPTWSDVIEVEQVLWSKERDILEMMRCGRSPSDVAVVMGLRSRQHAEKEMRRVLDIVRLYARHMDAVRMLYESLPIDRRRQIILRLYAVDRMSHSEIARRVGYAARWNVWSVISETKRQLRKTHPSIVELLNEIGDSRRRGSGVGRRRMVMKTEKWRSNIAEFLVGNVGKIWYAWGGQDVKNGVADCSGLVLELLKLYGRLPKNSPDMTANGIAKLYKVTQSPKPGDLVFYGKSWSKINHVMIYLGRMELQTHDLATGEKGVKVYENCVAGMSGGRRNMTTQWAKMVGAGLFVKTSARYRNDFLGFKRVV